MKSQVGQKLNKQLTAARQPNIGPFQASTDITDPQRLTVGSKEFSKVVKFYHETIHQLSDCGSDV